jgi:hypothetical protein
MNWPKIDDISAKVSLPDGYRFEQLKRSEIPLIVAGLTTQNLTPRTAALFDSLFPGKLARG